MSTEPDGAGESARDRFTLPPFDGERSWPAVRYGAPWNGFATPVVHRETLEDLLQTVGDGHRWEGDVVVLWPTIDLQPGEEPDEVDRLDPTSDGLYDLGELGWVFERVRV